jgi:hypothetical protein
MAQHSRRDAMRDWSGGRIKQRTAVQDDAMSNGIVVGAVDLGEDGEE